MAASNDKTDMPRVGLFKEMKYISIGDNYVPSSKFTFNQSAYKGKQMLPGPIKERTTGLQDGYFTKPFPRVFEKEAYSDPIGTRRRERMQAAKKNVVPKAFITFHGEKRPEGLGSTYGTFAGRIEYFSPKKSDKKTPETSKANIKTNPSKKGTGYGYVNVALNKYPEYKSEKYNSTETQAKENYEKHKKSTVGGPFKNGKFHKVYFDKNPFLNEKDGATYREKSKSKSESDLKPFKPSSPPKKMGNNKDGCFTKYPNHSEDAYKPITDYKPLKRIMNNSGKLFTPQQGPKSIRQPSVINYNVNMKINPSTYKQSQNYSTYNLKAVTA